MFYRFRDRKRWPQFLDFCKQLRRRFPAGKIYLVCDNYGPRGKAEVTHGALITTSNWSTRPPMRPG
jgi:hypothetical protein